jgi:8-oxo-dGTP pyrophosphatase MutT (NUDIX family)
LAYAAGVIVFDRNGTRFNFRVGGIICRADNVLLQTTTDIDFWVVPGGRVEMLEAAEEALAREIHEELGVQSRVGRLLWIVESFFPLDEVRFHEIAMYFLADVPANVPDHEFDSPEPGIHLRLRWFSLGELPSMNLKPRFLREHLRHLPATSEYIVIRE